MRDPRLPILRRRFHAREYVSRLYVVHWDDGAELARSLDKRSSRGGRDVMTSTAIANPQVDAPVASHLWHQMLTALAAAGLGLRAVLRPAIHLAATGLRNARDRARSGGAVQYRLGRSIPVAVSADPLGSDSLHVRSRPLAVHHRDGGHVGDRVRVLPALAHDGAATGFVVADILVRHDHALDRPRNACPSLHAAFAILAVLSFEPLLRVRSSFTAWSIRVAVWLWAGLILYATVATPSMC